MTDAITAQSGSMSLQNTTMPYVVSFGDMKAGTYYAGLGHDDLRPTLKSRYVENHDSYMQSLSPEMKALLTTAGGAGTAGNAMIPIYVDPKHIDRSRKLTPFRELIPRFATQGLTIDYTVTTAKGAAISAVEDAALSDVADTKDRLSISIKYLYSVGRVTGPMQAAMPAFMLQGFSPSGNGLAGTTYGDVSTNTAKQHEVALRTRALAEMEENMIFNGNSTTSGISGNPDGTEFDGITALMSTTNTVDLNTSVIDYDDVETAAQNALDDSGRPSIVASCTGFVTDLRKNLLDSYRYHPESIAGSEITAGIGSRMTLETVVGPQYVVPTQYLVNTSGSKRLYMLDMDVVDMGVLQDYTFEQAGKSNDSDKFWVKCYEALRISNPNFCAQIQEGA